MPPPVATAMIMLVLKNPSFFEDWLAEDVVVVGEAVTAVPVVEVAVSVDVTASHPKTAVQVFIAVSFRFYIFGLRSYLRDLGDNSMYYMIRNFLGR
jgi:hypothetical protein